MKTKFSILSVALYIVAILFSCGLFSAFNFTRLCYAETDDEVLLNCSVGEEIDRQEPVAYASTGTSTSYDTYLEAYFANLTENFGRNDKGSCGYVAAGMMLSYFDNCYSDDIIPERYDVRSTGTGRNMNTRGNSPGTMDDNHLFAMYKKAPKYITAQEYHNYLIEYENYSFHAKLILFAEKACHLYNYDVPNDKSPCGISIPDLIRVIQLYLIHERGYKEMTDFWFKYPKSKDEETVKRFIIDQIDAGVPVCVFIGKMNSDGTKSYHFVVAYAHDDSGNIYLHSGWHSYGTRETISGLGYQYFNDAFTLNFHIPEHIHTDNYAVTVGDTKNYYCYCSDEIVTYNHTEHNYRYDYTKVNTTKHYVYCACGDYVTEEHNYNYNYTKINTTKHGVYCACGDYVTEEHNYNYNYTQKNELTHTACCQCGATSVSSHTWTGYSNPDLRGEYVQCKVCKFIKKLVDENVNVTLGLRNYEDYCLSLFN